MAPGFFRPHRFAGAPLKCSSKSLGYALSAWPNPVPLASTDANDYTFALERRSD